MKFFYQYKWHIWYILLVGIYLLFAFRSMSAPMPLRFLYVFLWIFPGLKEREWLPGAISIPYIILNYCGGMGDLLPSHTDFYILIGILICLFVPYSYHQSKIPKSIFLFLFYTTFINLIIDINGVFMPIVWSSILLICSFYLYKSTEKSKNCLSFQLICLCFVLSICFIFLRQNFDAYSVELSDLEETRTGWMDPNYFGTVLGMGAVCAIVEVRKSSYNVIFRMLYIAVVIAAIIALFLNASRGALLAFAASLVCILLFSKVKLYKKIFSILVIVGFLIYLYNNAYMDILEYRLQNDELTGSRMDIWIRKMNSFFSDYDLMNWIFGVGNTEVEYLGNWQTSVHNDFISCFIQYGIIGLTIYVALIFYPIIRLYSIRKTCLDTLTATIYLIVSLLSLNPITGGQYPYFFFLLYIYSLFGVEKSTNLTSPKFN